jgi:hypothetical protein
LCGIEEEEEEQSIGRPLVDRRRVFKNKTHIRRRRRRRRRRTTTTCRKRKEKEAKTDEEGKTIRTRRES